MCSRYLLLRVEHHRRAYTVVNMKPWKTDIGAVNGFSGAMDTAVSICHSSDQDWKPNDHIFNIRHLYHLYLQTYASFSHRSCNIVRRRQVEANLHYFHETLRKALETVVDLYEDDALTRICGKYKRDILEDIVGLHRDLSKQRYLAEGRSMWSESLVDFMLQPRNYSLCCPRTSTFGST